MHAKENHLLFASWRATSTEDTLAARKAYVWKMATTAEAPAVAEMPRYASNSNSNNHKISLAVFFQ